MATRVAFVGRSGLGGVQMRGRAVARQLGVPFVDLRDISRSPRFDVIVLVKYWGTVAKTIRSKCNTLVFDPLDCFTQLGPNDTPESFWKRTRQIANWDHILATSPACRETMKSAGPTFLVPHHADPCINADWHNPRGPVVYCGGERFITSRRNAIAETCKAMGRQLVLDFNRTAHLSLEGAALSLHPRFAPQDTPLNVYCKPQVKLENANAAGVPTLATADECVLTPCADVPPFAESSI